VEREEEMDKIDFVFTEFREDGDKTNVEGVGARTVKKWHCKLKGKVTDTVGWKKRLVSGRKGKDEPAQRRRLERPAWQVERREQASRLEMREEILGH